MIKNRLGKWLVEQFRKKQQSVSIKQEERDRKLWNQNKPKEREKEENNTRSWFLYMNLLLDDGEDMERL